MAISRIVPMAISRIRHPDRFWSRGYTPAGSVFLSGDVFLNLNGKQETWGRV